MKSILLLVIVLLFPLEIYAETSAKLPLEIVEELRQTPVSRFEWGLERYRLALIEYFRIDPISLESSVPPFFINVNFDESKPEILVEIGRTFGSTQDTKARQYCEDYLIRARSMLAVDRIGHPVVRGVSSLAKDFFMPIHSSKDSAHSVAQALDSMVTLRGLVVAPASGIYSVCAAKLTGMPIKHLE